MNNSEKTMDKLVTLCKGRGFIFAGSEIYGGLANTWDYGPLGVELKNNVKKAWWKKFVQETPYNVGLDAAILMNPQAWVASGHRGRLHRPADGLQGLQRAASAPTSSSRTGARRTASSCRRPWTPSARMRWHFIEEHAHRLPHLRQAQLYRHPPVQPDVQDLPGRHRGRARTTVYLRPETAQGIFVNFPNIQRTTRKKLPFGVCQIGKSFRNEITPGNFTFRTREFEQMELEFFCKPGTDLEWFQYWRNFCHQWLLDLGMHGREPAPARPRARGAVPSTPRPPRTLSTCSPSAGASCGAWPTAPTTT